MSTARRRGASNKGKYGSKHTRVKGQITGMCSEQGSFLEFRLKGLWRAYLLFWCLPELRRGERQRSVTSYISRVELGGGGWVRCLYGVD